MRYVRPAVPELLTLLQTELRRTTDALLVASAVDAAGVSLFREQVAAALDAGGGVTFVVSTASAAASVRDGLGLPNVGRLTVLVRDLPTSLNACVLTSVDGVMRGYVGSNDFRHAALAAGAPGVLLDGARDRGAVAELHEDLQALVDAVPRSAAGQPLVDLMQPTMDALERRHGRRAQQEGTFVPTGFADLDALTGGLLKGDLWVMTGRSGVGKSVLATDFLRSVAVRTGAHAALAQARDTREMTVQRILSAEARVPMYHLQTTGLTDEDWTRLARKMGQIAEAPLWIATPDRIGTVAPSAELQLRVASELAAEHELQLLVVDDLPITTTAEQLHQLKTLAVEGASCVLAVIADGPDRSLDEVEAAAAVAADVIVRLDRDHDMTPGGNDPRAGEADLLIRRHRRGPIARITVDFQGHYSRFTDSRPGGWLSP